MLLLHVRRPIFGAVPIGALNPRLPGKGVLFVAKCAQWEMMQHSSYTCRFRQDVNNDRNYGARLEMDAEIAKSNGEPWESLYLMVDAANQSNFATPLGASNAHGVDDR